MKPPIKQGQDAAIRALEAIRDYVDCLPEPDRSQWYCGWITASASWATAHVGFRNVETMLMAAREVIPQAIPPAGKGAGNE